MRVERAACLRRLSFDGRPPQDQRAFSFRACKDHAANSEQNLSLLLLFCRKGRRGEGMRLAAATLVVVWPPRCYYREEDRESCYSVFSVPEAAACCYPQHTELIKRRLGSLEDNSCQVGHFRCCGWVPFCCSWRYCCCCSLRFNQERCTCYL